MRKERQQLINFFNRPYSVLLVSSYPEVGIKHSGKVCAVGSFVKNTLQASNSYLQKSSHQRKFVVLTVIIDKEEVYEEEGVLVWRIFKRGSPLSYLKLLKTIAKFSQIKDILIEFEFASLGDIKTTALFPVILLWLKILGKKNVLVLHQVIVDLKYLVGHLGWSRKDLRIKIFNLALKAFFWILVFLSQKVVVLEEIFKQRLIKMTGLKNKIVFIPHGVDKNQKIVSGVMAKKMLGLSEKELILLYFGYLNWYKGVDFLIKTFVDNNIRLNGQSIKLIIAGGESITQKRKLHYQKFVKKVYSLAKNSSRIKIIGFVEEKDIPYYFAAADLVILPYRVMMSSSGPLSLACTFSKPFIMSAHLSAYFESNDFFAASQEAKLKKEDFLFELEPRALVNKIKSALKAKNLAKLAEFSENLAKKRDFGVLAASYESLLTTGQKVQYGITPQVAISS